MSQSKSLLSLLADGEPHRTDEIMSVCYGSSHLGLARVAARAYDLKKKGYSIRSWRDPLKKTLWYYQLSPVQNPNLDYSQSNRVAPSQSSTPGLLFKETVLHTGQVIIG